MKPVRPVLMTASALILVAGGGSVVASDASPVDDAGSGSGGKLSGVYPVPRSMKRVGPRVKLGGRVFVVADKTVDKPARRAAVQALRSHNVTTRVVRGLDRVPGKASAVLLTGTGHSAVRHSKVQARRVQRKMGLQAAAASHDEGYVLASGRVAGHRLVMVQGHDGAGSFYGVQTLRQVLSGRARSTAVPGVQVADHPSYGQRGVIEGFYGAPWSDAARLDQMRFYGRNKMNSYVYSPKDDEYLRSKWKQTYPKDKLAVLKKLVGRARANHVEFTYALSPGLSVCYSSESDLKALNKKLESLWDIGVRSFSIPLDDISYTKWNCDADKKKFGTGGGAAGKAQSYLLNKVQKKFIAKHDGAEPLQMVPTEYYDVKHTDYKAQLSKRLDSKVLVGWTGVGVIAPKITTGQAAEAKKVFGHKLVLWDNYPVNDYVTSRLLMGPYVGRQSGMTSSLAGVTANPMVQPESSKIAEFNAADFTWNDRDYQPKKSWQASLTRFAGGNPKARRALEQFADLNYASRLDDTPAPQLADATSTFWKKPDAPAAAKLHRRLRMIQRIRPNLKLIGNQRFNRETAPWTKAATLWGRSANAGLRAYMQAKKDHPKRAKKAYQRSKRLEKKATNVTFTSIDGDVKVKIGHGVLDTFVDKTHDKYQALS